MLINILTYFQPARKFSLVRITLYMYVKNISTLSDKFLSIVFPKLSGPGAVLAFVCEIVHLISVTVVLCKDYW